jgi:hypothetical protein
MIGGGRFTGANLRRGSWRIAVAAGVVGGASIFVCYTAASLITDHLIS